MRSLTVLEHGLEIYKAENKVRLKSKCSVELDTTNGSETIWQRVDA